LDQLHIILFNKMIQSQGKDSPRLHNFFNRMINQHLCSKYWLLNLKSQCKKQYFLRTKNQQTQREVLWSLSFLDQVLQSSYMGRLEVLKQLFLSFISMIFPFCQRFKLQFPHLSKNCYCHRSIDRCNHSRCFQQDH